MRAGLRLSSTSADARAVSIQAAPPGHSLTVNQGTEQTEKRREAAFRQTMLYSLSISV